MIDFTDIKHHGWYGWSEDGNNMWTEDAFSEDVETIMIGGNNSDESADTDDSEI